MRYQVSQTEVENILSLLNTLDSSEFESFVARLWWLFGWDVEITQESHDGGIDVWARRSRPGDTTETIAIQAKRKSGTISVGTIREYASLQLIDEVDSAVLVTTAELSDTAEEQAAKLGLKPIDGEQLSRIILEYGWQEEIIKYFLPDR